MHPTPPHLASPACLSVRPSQIPSLSLSLYLFLPRSPSLSLLWVGNSVGNSEHVTGKYRDESMLHACSRQAAWVPHTSLLLSQTPSPRRDASAVLAETLVREYRGYSKVRTHTATKNVLCS